MTVSLVPLGGILSMGSSISPCFFSRWSRQAFTKSIQFYSQGEIATIGCWEVVHLKQVNLCYGDVML